MDTDQQTRPQISSGAAASIAERQPLVGDIEQFVRDVIAQLQPAIPDQLPGPGRPRILPALCLWAGLLVVVLQGGGSQLAIWRLLTTYGLWDYPRFALSDQAIYKRMAAAGTGVLERLFAQISEVLRVRLAPLCPPRSATQGDRHLGAR